jgi:hypothetical protein
MHDATVFLEGNINDRLPSMRYLVEKLSSLHALGGGDSACLDLSKLCYIGPDGMAMVAGSVLDARRRHVDVRVEAPSGPPALAAFFEFSGFNHLILGTSLPQGDHAQNVTIPLQQFDRSDYRDSDSIVELVARFESVSADLRYALEVAVNECNNNVEDHAQSLIGAIRAARFMAREREVRVALIDWGVGILNSLRGRYPEIRGSQDALERVLYGGYTAKARKSNQGRGIDNLRAVVTEAFGGSLFIVSGDAAVDIRGGREPRCETWPFAFNGTAVCFTLPVQPRS